jgi:bifunctional UDP-N-acetylglucosamine pyrophosphorylase/glucosamine-1-phosphate N-acetyltransferase
VLYADTPLLQAETFRRMQALKSETRSDLVMLTATGPIPGRVVRDPAGRVAHIVEAQDASPEELAIEERNSGVYLLSASLLREGLAQLDDNNHQGELYLTDVVGYAVRKGLRVEALLLEDADACLGINDRADLALASAVMRRRIAERHMAAGVTLIDPERTYIDADVEIGRDSLIEPGCVIQGESVLGEGVHVKAHCTIESSRLDDDVVIGPCAHLRPGNHLMKGVKIGNFVELKNSVMGPGSKSAHLSYIGDADVGEDVNFGCGSIVVNYDGVAKHRTRVGDGAFIGCNANLISPVTLHPRAFVAAGSTISSDVPEEALAVGRAKQRNIAGWVARREGRSSGTSTGTSSGRNSAETPAARKKGAAKKKTAAKKKGTAKKKSAAKKKRAAKKKSAVKKKAVVKRKGAARKKATARRKSPAKRKSAVRKRGRAK